MVRNRLRFFAAAGLPSSPAAGCSVVPAGAGASKLSATSQLILTHRSLYSPLKYASPSTLSNRMATSTSSSDWPYLTLSRMSSIS